MWSKQRLLQINPTRIKAVFFTLKRQLTHLHYSSNCVYQNTHKHLGIALSNNFSWSTNKNTTVNKNFYKDRFPQKVQICSRETNTFAHVCHFCQTSTRIFSDVWEGCKPVAESSITHSQNCYRVTNIFLERITVS